MTDPFPATRQTETMAGTDVEIWRAGSGRPILLLHGLHDIDPVVPFVAMLTRLGEVIAPTHPGFGNTERRPEFSTIYDLVHHYRDVLETIPDAVVVGFSFGGWIAAELAAARAPMAKLILVDSLGIRLGQREQRDIAHFFNTSPQEMLQRGWSDPTARPTGAVGAGWPVAIDEYSDEELLRLQRSGEALSLYGWKPHMFNPQLKNWLHRIRVPTLVLWGEQDRIVSPDYGRRFSALIPGATFRTIPSAGHHPELEQPGKFAEQVADFIGAH